MEKIYDENQQKQQQKKKIKIDGVSMLAFAVALFAIVSLVAAGVSGFSYAIPDTDPVQLPDSFTSKEDTVFMYDFDGDIGTDYHYYMDNSEWKDIDSCNWLMPKIIQIKDKYIL